MMDIKEVSSKISNSFGGYGVPILAGALVLLFISNLSKSSDDETMVAPSGYSAYPDAVTNANVIIGEVNDHTTAEIKNLGDNLQENIGAINDNVTNTGQGILDKINESTTTVSDKIDSSTTTVSDKIDSSTTTITNTVNTATENIKKSNADTKTSLINQINNNQQSYNKIMQENTNLKKQLEASKAKTAERQARVVEVKSKLQTERKENKSLKKQFEKIVKKTGYKGSVTGTATSGIRGKKVSTKFK